jgi:hypothetical protein
MRSAAGCYRRRAGDGTLVVCLERADTPVRILEDLGVLSNILLARFHTVKTGVHRTARLSIDVACPVTTESVGEDEALVHEALFNIAVTLEVGVRGSELGCIWLARLETGGGATTGEEPHLNTVGLPLCNVVTAFVGVEAFTVGVGVDIVDIAARSTRGAIKGAVVKSLDTGLSLAVSLAVGVGVKHELVDLVLVDTLDDVNLSLDGPWLAAEGPEGGPSTADTTGHVLYIEDKKSLVVLLSTLKTDTFTANVFSRGAIQLGLVINTKDCITFLETDVALRLSSCAIDISAQR